MQQTLVPWIRPVSQQSKIAAFVEEFKFLTNWETLEHDGWHLPCIQEPHDWCGMWKTEGCLNEKQHEKLGYGRRIYVKQYQRSCYRASCKTCYLKWIFRQANKANRRIEKYSEDSGRKAIHAFLSIPLNQYTLPYKEQRKRLNQILKEVNIEGAAVIFHPFRFRKINHFGFYSPHFHLVGFGHMQKIAETFAKYGWFIKFLGFRESVFQTICYLLSHCGIKKGHHTLTWLGNLSYSKLKLEKEPDSTICPLCGRKFIEIYHDGVHPVVPPDKMYFGLVDSGDWYPVQTVPKSEWTRADRYEYALEKELYNANLGILN